MKKIRVRNMSWKDYGILPEVQRELREFCFQYEEKRRDENSERGKNCRMIEAAAKEADEVLAPYLLLSVAEDKSYDQILLEDQKGILPVGKTDFYGYRRKLYACLKKSLEEKSGSGAEKNGDKMGTNRGQQKCTFVL